MATAHFTRTVYKSGSTLARGRVQYMTRTGPYQRPAAARVPHRGGLQENVLQKFT